MQIAFTQMRVRAATILLAVVGSSPTLEAALTFTVDASWPNATHRNAAVAAIQAVTDRYNAYGDFGNYNVYVYYNAGIPTAQASYQGSIGFGGTYPNERVMAHEMAHYLGLPSGNWGTLMSGGTWDGTRGVQLVRQFDGDQATLNGDSIHFWPYGLNFDNEGGELNMQRQVAMVYAMRADLGIGPRRHPSSAAMINAIADDPVGQSAFNYKTRWSDGYFAHPGAAYFSGDHVLRTPASPNSFTFAGSSLTINNTNGASGGLFFQGSGAAGVVTVNNLILDGGWIHHGAGINDRFRLDGTLNVSGGHLRAQQGNIDILADVVGGGTLTIEPTAAPLENNRYVRFLSPDNSFVGDIVNTSRFELAPGAAYRFAIGPDGSSNAISGDSARNTLLNGLFEFDFSGASFNTGDSWSLVRAANTVYGSSFEIPGFTSNGENWSNGRYSFSQATGVLTLVPNWNVDGGGLWSEAANWVGGVPVENGDATFGPVLTAPSAPASVNLSHTAILGRLAFDSLHRYVLSGTGSIELTGTANVVVDNGSHEIAVPLVGGAGLNVRGGGTLTLTAQNSYTGDTHIHFGTLALGGAARISNTSTIYVHPGATLDVSGLPGPLELGEGQTLSNNSVSTVVGDVVATSGALIEGNGVFDGNVTAGPGGVVRVGGQGLPRAAGHSGIDDFQTYSPGKLANGASGGVWTGVFNGTANAEVVSDGDNRMLQYYGTGSSWRGAYSSLASSFAPEDHSLSDGDTSTYFFRVQRQGTQTIDGIFGLTNLESIGVTAPWQELAITLSLFQGTSAGDATALRAFDNDGGGDVIVRNNVAAGEWINVWLLVDNQAKTYEIATSTGTDDGTLFARSFEFGRQMAQGEALDTFAGAEFRSNSNPAAAAVRIDDLYRLDGFDLSNPLNVVGETLTVDGDLTLGNGARLELDVANPNAHDRLVVTGTTFFGGTLELTLAPGSTLAAGDEFDLFDFAGAAGSFENYHLPSLDANLSWDSSQMYSAGLLRVVAGLEGDYNQDGVVNAADYVVWRNQNGTDAVLPNRDPNLSGSVDQADYDYWVANFGNQVGGGVGAQANVPEPAALALLGPLLAAALVGRVRPAARVGRRARYAFTGDHGSMSPVAR